MIKPYVGDIPPDTVCSFNLDTQLFYFATVGHKAHVMH